MPISPFYLEKKQKKNGQCSGVFTFFSFSVFFLSNCNNHFSMPSPLFNHIKMQMYPNNPKLLKKLNR